MKTVIKLGLFIVGLLLLMLVFKMLYIGGAFKSINNFNLGKTEYIYTNMAGTEDIDFDSKHQLLLISSSNRWASMLKNENRIDNIYALDVNDTLNTNPKRILNTFRGEFHPHGISIVQQDSSTYVFVVNHNKKGSFVEKFLFKNGTLMHLKTYENDLMFSPNDVAAVTDSTFYVTNDHGYRSKFKQTLENYLQLPKSYLLYFDGTNYKKVVSGLKYANGVNLSNDKSEVYLATTTGQKLYIYTKSAQGTLKLRHYVNTHTGIDNITVDSQGDLWLAAHPKLLKFSQHAKDSTKISPSEVIRIHKLPNGIYKQEKIYLNNGLEISGTSVAYKFKNYIFIGDVFQHKLLKINLSN
ncbi:MAG: hypothetical protein GW847_00175 [Zetaproteobacteria bacterium]|nr:hypothetical protein [Zetaproteobacteria bacterium]